MFGRSFSGVIAGVRAYAGLLDDRSPLSGEERAEVVRAVQRHNITMARFLVPVAVLTVLAMVLVDLERWRLGTLQGSATHQTLLVVHVLFLVATAYGLRYYHPRWNAPGAGAGRDLAVFFLLMLGSVDIMSMLGIVERGSTTLMSIALMLMNLVFRLPVRLMLLLNVLLLAGACVLRWSAGHGFASLLIGLIELLALSFVTLVCGYGLHRLLVLGVLNGFREARHRLLQEELEIAARVQRSLLPREWPQSPAFSIAGFMQPARNVGGDYFDHFAKIGGKLGLVIADVSDKGVPAGLFGIMCRTVTRSAMLQGASLDEAFEAINRELSTDNEECMFVTCIGASYDAASGLVRLVNAGHVAPFLMQADGQRRWVVGPRNPALGLRSDRRFHSIEVALGPGDLLLFMTDGVTEAMNRAGEAFGTTRVEEALRDLRPEDAQACLRALTEAVAAFCGGVEPSDDITCLALLHRSMSA